MNASDNKETILTSDLSEYLISKCGNIINSYSAGLLKLSPYREDKRAASVIGSGTLVSINGIKGILTAHHVSELLQKEDSLALLLLESEHRMEIECKYLHSITIGRGPNEYEGPDFSFIIIPEHEIAKIKPYRQFFDLSGYRENMIKNRPDPHIGIWFIWGIPDEYTEILESVKGSGKVISFTGGSMLVGPVREYTHGEYDYIEANVDYYGLNKPPGSFGGISGGGLWFIPIKRSGDTHEPADFILSGVAFYQSEIINSKRFIKCHGILSLYQHAYKAIAAHI